MTRILIAFGSLLGIQTCADSPVTPGVDDSVTPVVDADGGVYTTTLYAEDSIDVGTVSIRAEGDHLAVIYDLSGYWYMDEASLWIGSVLDDLPLTRSGDLDTGRFSYGSGDSLVDVPVHSYTFEVDFEDLEFECFQEDAEYMALAHAVVFEDGDGDGYPDCIREGDDGDCAEWDPGETALGDGVALPGATRWGSYLPFDLTCPVGDGHEGCETAFSYDGVGLADSTCFDEWDFHRSGWTNGPIGYGTWTWDLYAGAEACDVMTASLVGTVTVAYDEGTVTTTWTPAEGWTLHQARTYAGAEPLPTKDDGSYTVISSEFGPLSDEYPLGDIYVANHVVACPAEE